MGYYTYTKAEEDFLREHIDECWTLHSLVDMFNAEFPNHQIKYAALGKKLTALGIRKGTHNVRKGIRKGCHKIGTIISNKTDGRGVRVKTENGYVTAHKYFLNLLCGENAKNMMLIHLNGDKSDFSAENIEVVPKSVYHSMCWRSWFFKDRELTKTAILTVKLLEFFPDLRHDESHFLGLKYNKD